MSTIQVLMKNNLTCSEGVSGMIVFTAVNIPLVESLPDEAGAEGYSPMIPCGLVL
jgi:hypothetical protein